MTNSKLQPVTMTSALYKHILEKQNQVGYVPDNEKIADWASKLISLLFPELSSLVHKDEAELDNEFRLLEAELHQILQANKECDLCDNKKTARRFFESIPELYRVLYTDIEAIVNGDPAAKSEFEVIRAYPGFTAVSYYRIAHNLYRLDVPLIPRILTEQAHSKTGIDIHPAAQIDEYLMIDHGTGIVIGETAKIGKYVKIYQGVTLGALSVDKKMASIKRHPTIEDHVILYSNATILGGDTVVGRNSIIGGNVWLTKSVPPGSFVYHNPDVVVEERRIKSV
ncbi:serine O-acetyltransferase EpsC [Pollutibacter soli]|uniref:serine O-acetyltransferase EpsC n=1 Tax=Pollutibacter soli TaxID=3034157 RepID=UPI0030138760